LALYQFAGASSFATNTIVLHWTGWPIRQPLSRQPSNTAQGLNEIYAAEINLAAAVPSLVLPAGDGKNILTHNLAIPHYITKKAAGRQDLVGGEDIWEQTQVLKWSAFLSS
jgi:hypothetical protein